MAKSVGIVARLDRSEALNLVLSIAERFKGAGFSIFFEPCLAEQIGGKEFSMPLEDMRTDLIVTVGGDGTILRTCLRIPKPEPPILAIGMGARGFLTEVLPEKAFEAVDRYIKGLYRIETCRKIASFVGEDRLPDALNEIFITSRHLAKTLSVRIWKNSVSVADFSADGVIIASQVGSTAYSFSSGGPILDPEVDALVLTPVCPISLMRSIVFPSSSHVTVELLRPKAAVIVIDGDYQRNMGDGETKVTVGISEHKSRFIRFEDGFYRRLKDRLLLPREEI
ncbi:MAG: NAD(+)/NADH kinase [Candidatus Bathyarchaeia archaeon]|nr:NAD(+)/NADH kinase [Candidatus Bathyarchaeota archaeon]